MTVRELITKIGFKVDEASAKRAETRTEKMSKKMKFAIIGIATGILAIGKMAVDAASEMEMLTTQFEVMLGSAEKAEIMMKDLTKFAAETPFSLTDLAKGTQTLLSYGIESNKVIDTMKMLGDTAKGNAENIMTLSTAFGRIQAEGKATGETLNMIQDRGIGIFKQLAELRGVTVAEIRKMVSKGQVSSVDVQKAFETMTSAGGMFFEGMKKQSLTFMGLVSTMKDNFKLLLAEVGTTFLPTMKLLVETITKLVQGPLKEFIQILTEALVPILNLVVSLLQPILKTLNPILKIFVSIIKVIVKILGTILIPFIEMLLPIFELFGEILNFVFEVLEALFPLFQALGLVFKILGKLFSLFMPILRPFIRILAQIAHVIGNQLAVAFKLLAFLLEPTIWMLEKLMPLFDLLGKSIDFLFNTVLSAVTVPLEWMAEKISYIIDGLRDLFGWLAELVGMEGEPITPPSVTKGLESGSLENRTANITMNNKIAMTTAAGPTGGVGEAAKSVFTVELQKILINAGY